MKSPMVTNKDYIADKAGYSDLQVLSSAAGYYIGTLYTGPDGLEEPGSRDSEYYKTRVEAEQELAALTEAFTYGETIATGMGDKIIAAVLRDAPSDN